MSPLLLYVSFINGTLIPNSFVFVHAVVLYKKKSFFATQFRFLVPTFIKRVKKNETKCIIHHDNEGNNGDKRYAYTVLSPFVT